MKPTLWIVSELFYPEETSTAYILTEIALELKEKYNVKVITGEPVYETVKEREEDFLKEISVYRIKGSRGNKNNILMRLKRAVFLAKSFSMELKRNAQERDKVLAVTNPAFNILDISKVCKKKKLNLVILAHDIFPENAISAGFFTKKSLIYKFLLKRFNVAYNSASKIIACGEDMKSILENKISENNDISISVVSNWANTDNLRYESLKTSDKIILKFAGNIGRVQGIQQVINMIQKVDNSNLEFIFQGSGACVKKIKDAVGKNITYKPSYQRHEEQRVLSECTIGLVTLEKGMYGIGVPSKTYNIMACGRPILFIGPQDSEIYNLVKKYDIGWAFDILQTDEIVLFLNNIRINNLSEITDKGLRARDIAEKYFAKEIILKKFLEEI